MTISYKNVTEFRKTIDLRTVLLKQNALKTMGKMQASEKNASFYYLTGQ